MTIQIWPSTSGPYFVRFGRRIVDLREVAAIERENVRGPAVSVVMKNGAVVRSATGFMEEDHARADALFDQLWYLLSNLVNP